MRPAQNLCLTEIAVSRAKQGDYRALSILIDYEKAFEDWDKAQFRTEKELALISIEECERKLKAMTAA